MLSEREQRGLQIAALAKIEQTRVGWKVPSQSGNGSYIVNVDGQPFCTCPDFEARQQPCKHVFAVTYVIQREERPDGTTTYTRTVEFTYGQHWTAYHTAQVNEGARFAELLRGLCNGIQQPPQAFGRPRLPLADMVFSAVLKVYSTMSGRRFISDLNDCVTKGLLAKAPHYNSTFNAFEDPALTPLLKTLIEESASPLRAIETDFAVDSSGFSTTTYDRWFDHKYGRVRSEAKWIKTHLICGVKTHVVTSAEATPTETADAPQLPALLNATAETFPIYEVSADKAYSSRKNLRAIESVGGVAYIPFKNRTTGIGNTYDALWQRMWHYYNFNRAEFLVHYHKRSNVETTFSMIKAKFSGAVRSKTPVAQVNEVLCKVLAHNLCVLIQSIYELGIAPTFWADSPVAHKVDAI